MREINIQVFDDKSLKTNNSNLGNKLDNGITKLNFNFDNCSFYETLTYRYVALKNYNLDIFYLVPIQENYFVLSDFYTKQPGTYDLLIILSNREITDGNIDNDGTNFVSNSIKMTITDNFLNDEFIIKTNEEAI